MTETNPENGTTSYAYDSDATCGSSNGDLVRRQDAVGNVTCYHYDALHRVTSITYPSGSYASVTPSKYFVYDSASITYNNVATTMANPKNRLVEAFTCTTCPATKITDLAFSYSARGETTDIYESTPHSNGWYHVGGSYWANGALNVLSTNIAGLPAITYGADGEGRVSTVGASSGQNPVSGTSYNVASQVTNVTLGSGDSDYYAYDPNTGRMTQYQFRTAPPVPNTVDVRFTNDSCSGCNGGTPVGGGDRNLFVNNIVVGSTTVQGNDPSVSYAPTGGCNRYENGIGILACNGDMVSTNPVPSSPSSVTVNAYGSPDYDIYPHMQLLINGSIAGEWDVTGTSQNYSVDKAPVTGQLTWNANGSLQSLAISDPFNAANTQTCTYSHDDLSRASGVNCTNWSQTFGFDPFGNITKDGSFNFHAAYTTTTNQIATITGAPAPTYDQNGNLLTITDGTSHSYSWDAEGKQIGIDTLTATYDALGRMVELNSSGAYTQTVYGLGSEKLALMTGQNMQKSFIALPSGTAVYTASGLSYYRHSDWLGSSRFASTASGGMYSSSAYAPFGEQYATAGTSDPSFTSQQPDSTSGLYDFLFRRLSQTQGRWISPDPAGLGAVSLESPQSFNRYAYVMNRSSELVDPKGLNADAGMWWLQWRFESTGTTWDGDMIGGGGGGFPSAMEEILATSYQDYLKAVEDNFTVTNYAVCEDGTEIKLAGSYTIKQANAMGVCAQHRLPGNGAPGPDGSGLDGFGPKIPFAQYFVDPKKDGDQNQQKQPCTPDSQANAVHHAQVTFAKTFWKSEGWAFGLTVTFGCKAGPWGCLAGAAAFVQAQDVVIPSAAIKGSYDAYHEAFTNPTHACE